MIELSTVLKKSTGQISCNLDEEIAILNLDKAVYFGLEGVGAQIWQALEEPRSVEELCKLIVDGFEVDPEQCQSDVLKFLHNMQQAGLVEPVQ
jgi:predicted aldo/keto reductase-like oxidoreductase